jgi:glycerate kinase
MTSFYPDSGHRAAGDTIPIVPFSIIIAPDSFKGSLSARAVAEAIAAGWRSERPDDQITLAPQADGGEGTLDAIEAAVPGAVRHPVPAVTGPDGRPVAASWLELPGAIAVVELAESSGLPLMASPDPLGATTRGLGEVIAAALDAGAQSLLIGLGGSASTDGGAGALEALGLQILDHEADRSALRVAPPGGVSLLTDVSAPLLGPTGAAAIFGPQKGATPAQVDQLEARLVRLASLIGGDPTQPGAGAAGGAGYGFAAVWGATMESGADYLAALTGLDAALAGADVLVTGEGRFDAQSLGGKVIGQLLAKAPPKTVVIAGQLSIEPPGAGYALSDLAGSTEAALAEPERWAYAAGALAAREIST